MVGTMAVSRLEKKVHFQGPFNTWTVSNLMFSNDTGHDILYKVKSNNSKKFLVEPKSVGLIKPGETRVVHLLLSPLEKDELSSQYQVLLETAYPFPDRGYRSLNVSPDQFWHDSAAKENTKQSAVVMDIQLDADEEKRPPNEDADIVLA